MPSSFNVKKQKFWESQYTAGETEGPGWYQLLAPFTTDREEAALNYLKTQNLGKALVLDSGCGEGEFLRMIAPYVKKGVGADIAENRLKIAQKKSKNIKNISYKHADIDQKLPFRKDRFDVLVNLGVLEYSFDPYFSLQEMKRVLKPGGILILSVPNLAFLPERMKLLFGKLPSWPDAVGWQGGRLHNFTYGSVKTLLEEGDFTVTSQFGSGFLYQLRNIWPSLLTGNIITVAKNNR